MNAKHGDNEKRFIFLCHLAVDYNGIQTRDLQLLIKGLALKGGLAVSMPNASTISNEVGLRGLRFTGSCMRVSVLFM